MQTDTQKILHPGKQFIPPERYIQESILGTGGMKTVICAYDKETGRSVAMAVGKDFTGRSTEQFLHEARLTAGLEHPNIVPVHEIGVTAEGIPYFTMKLLTGVTLQKIIEELERRNPEYVKKYTLRHMLQIFLKICDAVAFAHAKGILHLDLKPANVQVGEYGEVLVLDWGLARSGENPDELDTPTVSERPTLPGQTADGVIKGTLEYMAPEQLLGQNRLRGPKWDIYSLGAILHAMFTLKPPVSGNCRRETVLQSVSGKVNGIRKDNFFHIPYSLRFIMYKALERRPRYRYDSVADLRKDVELYLSGYPAKAENAGTFIRLGFLLRRRQSLVMQMILFFFSGVVLLSFLMAGLYYKSLELEIYRHAEQQRLQAEKKQAALEKEMRLSSRREWLDILPNAGSAAIPVPSGKGSEDRIVFDGSRTEARVISGIQSGSGEYRVQGTLRWISGNGPFSMETGAEPWLKSLRFVFSPRKGVFRIVEKHTDDVLFERHFTYVAGMPYQFDIQVFPAEPNSLRISVRINGVLLAENFSPEFNPSSGRAPLVFRCSGAAVELTDFRLMDLGFPASVKLSDLGDFLLLRGAFREARDAYLNADRSAASPEVRFRARRRAQGLDSLLAAASQFPRRTAELRAKCPESRITMTVERALLSLTITGGRIPKDLDLEGLPVQVLHLTECTVEDLSVFSHLPLVELHVIGCDIRDLSPLDVSNLRVLVSRGNPIRDVLPLRGSALERVVITDSLVENLFPFRFNTNLRSLELNGGMIQDVSPLKGLSLERLELSNNRIRDISSLSGMHSLKELMLNHNLITDISPLRERQFRLLELSGNPVENPEVLRTISVRELRMDAAGLQWFPVPRDPENMEQLSLASNQLTALPDGFRQMRSLRQLDVSDNRLTSLAPLKEMKLLWRLDVSGNRLKKLSILQNLASLTHVYCSDNPVDDTVSFRLVRPQVLMASSLHISLDSMVFRYPPEKSLIVCSDQTPLARLQQGLDKLGEKNIPRRIADDLRCIYYVQKRDVERLKSRGVRIGDSIYLFIPMTCSFESALKIAGELKGEIPLVSHCSDLRAELERVGVPVWFRRNFTSRPALVSSRDFRFVREDRNYRKKSACLIIRWKEQASR